MSPHPATLLPGSTALMLGLLFVLGTLVGSFLNVCIYRLPHGLSIVEPPSQCPCCKTRLAPRDLIPLFSQASLGGRCRYCCAPISWRYAGIELLTGVLFMLAGWWAGPLGINAWNANIECDWAKLLQGMVFMATLVVIFWVDFDTRLIPLEAAFLLGLAGVARDAWETTRSVATETTGLTWGGLWPGQQILPAPIPNSLWAMVFASSVLWALRAVFSKMYGREALGFGDVVLVGAIAANLGWNGTLWTFAFASTVLGASIGLLLQIPRALRSRRWAIRRSHKYLQRARDAHQAPETSDRTLALAPAPEPSAPPETLPEALLEEAPAPAPAQVLEPPLDVPSGEWLRERASYWQKVAPQLIRHSLRRGMPFGPMLAIGAVAALLWGAKINESYLRALNPPIVAEPVVDMGTAPAPQR